VKHALALVAALVLAPLEARAHGFSPGYLELRERSDGRVEVLWKVPLGGEGGVEGREPMTVRLPPRCREVARREAVSVPGAMLDRYAVDCGREGLGGLTVSMESPEGRGSDVLVSARFASGQRYTGVLRAGAASLELPTPAKGGAWRVARSYLGEGVKHIATGADHLLFVLGLLLLVRAVGPLVRTITAFTVGHSVTLALATLGLVRVPQAPVEAVIALSILLLAVELSGDENTWTKRAPWLVAGGFGLLHGFGFAGALIEAGVPGGNVPLALFFFNVGVELGQVAFVAVCLSALHLVKRLAPDRSDTVRSLLGYVIGVASTYWFLERSSVVMGWFAP
jgi:hydrogenase/urease accessory protein HupE